MASGPTWRAEAGAFLKVEREWRDGDTVELVLPMAVTLRRWEANHDSVSVDRGPLTYSLRIDEEVRQAGGTEAWPAFEYLPASPWNYALVLDAEGLGGELRRGGAGVAGG